MAEAELQALAQQETSKVKAKEEARIKDEEELKSNATKQKKAFIPETESGASEKKTN